MSGLQAPALHPDVADLGFLLGTWAGEGRGEYPTIAPFGYREEISFGHVGKPFLVYQQRTWALDDGRGLHAETGYLRGVGQGRVEWVLAHPTGIAEVSHGSVSGPRLRLQAVSLGHSATAKRVDALERDIDVDPDAGVLTYAVRMAAVGVGLTHHLAARLHRRG